MLCLFLGHLIFRLNCHDGLLVWGSPHPSVYSHCCHVDSVQWLMSLVMCGHKPTTLSATQQRLLQPFTVVAMTYMQFFCSRKGISKSCSLSDPSELGCFSSLRVGKEIPTLVVHMFICREEKLLFCVPKEFMYCFRLINADHSSPVVTIYLGWMDWKEI